MKNSMYYTLLWTVVIAPHLSTPFMIGLSTSYAICSAIWVFIEWRERTK